MESTTSRSLTELKLTPADQLAIQSEMKTLLNKFAAEEKGIIPLLQLAQKNLPDPILAAAANDAIKTWIKLYASTDHFNSLSYTNRSIFFDSLAIELHKYKNPFAHFFKKELIHRWNEISRTLSDYFFLEFDGYEKNVLLSLHEDSAKIFDDHTLHQIQIRANILFRHTEPDKIAKIENIHHTYFSEFKTECDTYFTKQLEDASHFKQLLNNILVRNGDDQLLALNALLSTQLVTGTAHGILCLCAKILILTRNTQEAATRFQLTPQEIEISQKEAAKILAPFCEKDGVYKMFATFCTRLLKKPALTQIMQDRTISTDTLITVAITFSPELKDTHKGQVLNFYAKGVSCFYPTKNIDIDRFAEIKEALYPPIRLSNSPSARSSRSISPPVSPMTESKRELKQM